MVNTWNEHTKYNQTENNNKQIAKQSGKADEKEIETTYLA